MAPQAEGFFAGYDPSEKKSMRRMALALRYWMNGGRGSNSAHLGGLTNQQIATLEVFRVQATFDRVWSRLVEEMLDCDYIRESRRFMGVVNAMLQHVTDKQVPSVGPGDTLLITPLAALNGTLRLPAAVRERASPSSPIAREHNTPTVAVNTPGKISVQDLLTNPNNTPSSEPFSTPRKRLPFSPQVSVPSDHRVSHATGQHQIEAPNYYELLSKGNHQTRYASPYASASPPPQDTTASLFEIATPKELSPGTSENASEQLSQEEQDKIFATKLAEEELAKAKEERAKAQEELTREESRKYEDHLLAKVALARRARLQRNFRHILPNNSQGTGEQRRTHQPGEFAYPDLKDIKGNHVEKSVHQNKAIVSALEREERLRLQEEADIQLAIKLSLGIEEEEIDFPPQTLLSKRPSEDTDDFLPPAKRVNHNQDGAEDYKGTEVSFFDGEVWCNDGEDQEQSEDDSDESVFEEGEQQGEQAAMEQVETENGNTNQSGDEELLDYDAPYEIETEEPSAGS
ncbi:hypothetical protein EG329_009646 [Mollisiaceae sp. DMI_Dod_QoI]|nr:hypothetical protein EG329_009646 [Helotiales sp. DMI_Dod_QoI]